MSEVHNRGIVTGEFVLGVECSNSHLLFLDGVRIAGVAWNSEKQDDRPTEALRTKKDASKCVDHSFVE